MTNAGLKRLTAKTIFSDRFLMLAAAAIVFLAVLSTLDNDCDWGDDFAAYINQGIAIAEGRFDEQISVNAFMHPSPLPDEAKDSPLVYVWGYPLILALVYKIVGFDRLGFLSVICYKIPSLIALSLFAALIYLFFRKRFQKLTSFILAVLLCLHKVYIESVSTMYSDIVFLLLCWTCFYLAEQLSTQISAVPKRTTLFLGICMWACCAVRLNGTSVIAITALIQLCYLIKNRQKLSASDLGIHLLPYGVLILLSLLFNYLIFEPASSNMSDLGRITWDITYKNIHSYLLVFRYFFFAFPGFSFPQIFWRFSLIMFLPLIAVGLLRCFRKEFPYILFLMGTMLVLLLLPYAQGSRYCFPIFPVLFLLLGYCGEWIYSLIAGFLKPGDRRALQFLGFAAVTLLVCSAVGGSLSDHFIRILQGQDVRGTDSSTAYSATAVEAYRYIAENTGEDSVLAFEKPRVLFLNTGRLSFNPSVNGHKLEEADYYLACSFFSSSPVFTGSGSLDPVWSNGDFTLYFVNVF